MNEIEIKKIIKDLIQSDIKGDFTISNLHGVDLNKCLVEPYLEICEDSFHEGQTIELYVVLKEHPESDDGYQIAYDPIEQMFGLTIRGRGDRRVFLGFDGSFLESLKGM
jgi:hypothetical protein